MPKPGEAQSSVEEELADCLYTIIVMPSSMKIDLADNLEKVLTKVATRDGSRFEKKTT